MCTTSRLCCRYGATAGSVTHPSVGCTRSPVVQGMLGVPADTQRLICCGKQLSDEQQLGNTCRDGNTIHMTASLRGGKGGFGALLRNAGRARNTDNFDACRTLDGRRMREVEAEKKRAAWLADAQSRALEKVALQHLKDQAREARRAEAEQVDTQGVLQAQQQTLQSTQAAVADALAAGGRKRPAGAPAPRPAKKRGMLAVLEGSDEEEEEEEAMVSDDSTQERAGQGEESDQGAEVGAPEAPCCGEQIEAPGDNPPPPTVECLPAVVVYDAIDLSAFDSAEELQAAVSAEHLKAELQRVGLKCGGTPAQRAQRLFLLKSTPIHVLDAKHLAKK